MEGKGKADIPLANFVPDYFGGLFGPLPSLARTTANEQRRSFIGFFRFMNRLLAVSNLLETHNGKRRNFRHIVAFRGSPQVLLRLPNFRLQFHET
jgi:hypothetical protein